MKHRSYYAILLARTAALVFTLNTMTAYGGDCCFFTDATDQGGMVGEGMSMEMPCHQKSDLIQDSADSNDCCMMCVSMIWSVEPSRGIVPAAYAATISTSTPLLSSSVDPPFRPPISVLS